MADFKIRIRNRSDTSTNWTNLNPVLLRGEFGYDTDEKRFKIGDGVTAWNDLAFFPDTASAAWGTITGTLSDQTDLQGALDLKLESVAVPGDITASGTPDSSTFLRGDGAWAAPTATVDWGGIGGTLSNQTDLQTALDAKLETVATNDLTDAAVATPANRHVLAYDGVTDNQFENRLLVEADISDLQNYLTSEVNDLTAAVTWANVPDANITQTSVTQHEAALAITEAQITDLGSYADKTATETVSGAWTLNIPTFVEYTETTFALSGTTPAIDPANGTIQTWTLSGDSTPTSNLTDGQSVTLMIDDGSGFTITWTMVSQWIGGSAPTLATTGFTVINVWNVGGTVYGAEIGALS